MASGARIDHSGKVRNIDRPEREEMSQRRRSSLLDQMAMAALMEDISEGDSEDDRLAMVEDGVFNSSDAEETVGETEMVFTTELDDTSHEYSIDLGGLQGEAVSMMDFDIVDGEFNNVGVDFARNNEPTMMGATTTFRARPSYQSESMNRNQQAEPLNDYASLMYGPAEGETGSARVKRRGHLSLALPNAAGAADSMAPNQRRTSNRMSSIITPIGEESSSKVFHTSGSSILSFARRASRKTSQSTSSLGSDAFGTAIEKLKNNDSNNEWESVAAAVAVVQEGERRATGANLTRHNQFSAGDTVLVFLTLLNVTNSEDPKDTFTIAAVNKFGYPEGEGKTDDEKRGPYNFVLATVKQLHFEEDDRYYTIVRADTESEQRADSGWMEPLTDPAGQEAARRAAKKTIRSQSNENIELLDDGGYIQDMVDRITDAILYPAFYFTNTILPGYRKMRTTAKVRVSQLLYGDSPFACRVRVTGVNFLVLCSLIFLFLEVANLAFLPSDFDSEVQLVVLVAWIFLVVELLLEILIRPRDYSNLMDSDKAFAPSTARHISFFHIFFEAIALASFVPELWCSLQTAEMCHNNCMFSRSRSSLEAVLGRSPRAVMFGRFMMSITTFRFFGVVRHWKQALINGTYQVVTDSNGRKRLLRASTNDSISTYSSALSRNKGKKKKKMDDDNHGEKQDEVTKKSSEEDERLKNAATIGTALMVVNSQRALVLLTSIVIILPLLVSLVETNSISTDLTRLLHANNIEATDDCDYLKSAVDSWLSMAMVPQPEYIIRKNQEDTFVLWAQVLPRRCEWQRKDGVITFCEENSTIHQSHADACELWNETIRFGTFPNTTEYGLQDRLDIIRDQIAEDRGLRMPAIVEDCMFGLDLDSRHCTDDMTTSEYSVTVYYNQNPTVSIANMALFVQLLGILMLGLYSLQVLRSDAIRLVLDPLQRMLKIVLQYADNPLSHNVMKSGSKREDDFAPEKDGEKIGNYETEQLISAITKIADLLRKCWGIAGAGIISSNLARTVDGKTVVFNPTVPGKRVYALFGFVAINGFSDQLRRLDRDVMILINDVARVVHNEVYRWALGDHGQCNKNLGPAFLMVFRIGDFSEVHKKKQVADEMLFGSKKGNKRGGNLRNRRRRSGRRPGRSTTGDDTQINLASLPGIQGFTDRALLGMLKSFAGMHRDKNLHIWQSDFRLSDGVGNYCVDILYGMDAGWAVEGAVGSEYKIDATYLSPHVNMASRMMSATKQYAVTILLSKAVEELLSKNCRRKLRHLDTVYVKGSNVKQQIFTYDARHEGVDFFLIERSPSQADIDAEAYTPNIWDHDQDVKAMRQHISEDFLELFNLGIKEYLAGNWSEAYKLLEDADNKLIANIIDEGYIELDPEAFPGDIFDRNNKNEELVRLRQDLGDGACRVLMSYMKSRNLTAPADWDGVRKLSSK